jgi:hypothetical protein
MNYTMFSWVTESLFAVYFQYTPCCFCSELAGVLDKLYCQLSGVAIHDCQSTNAGTVDILCCLAGRYGYSVELD